jgi:hypothetical protein
VLDDIHYCVLYVGSDVAICLLMIGMHGVIANKDICSQIGSEDDQGVAEIDLMTLAVRQETFI